MSNVDIVEVQNAIFIGVRIIKMKTGVPQGFHRVGIVPGANPNTVLTAVNADLANLGCDAIADWSTVISKVAITHTPAVIAAYNQNIANVKAGTP